jgi:anti-sigma-K factor RskA
MGFSGAYGSAGDAESLGKFMHAARKRLAGHLPPTQPISPRATRRGQLLGTNYGWAPVAALAAAAAVMAALVLGGFGWATQSRLEKLIASMDAESSSVAGAH